MKEIKLSLLRIDGDTQGRCNVNQKKINEYAEKMEAGVQFPPLVVVHDGTTYWLVDGFHRYFASTKLNMVNIQVDWKPGTLEDAQVLSLGVNDDHGLPRTNADKRRSVEKALSWEHTKLKADVEIAKLCKVSPPFVASIRDSGAKKRQEENRIRSMQKKINGIKEQAQDFEVKDEVINPINVLNESKSGLPDASELEAMDRAYQADMEAMHMLLSSDDKLNDAHNEIKRLNALVADLETRNRGLQNERNEAIKQAKRLQKQVDKLTKKD